MAAEPSTNSHYLAGKKIIIVGAGFAGLAFAIALRQKWDSKLKAPHIVIYDRDDRHPPPSRLGYTVSLRGFDINGGLVVARDLGLLDAVLDKAVINEAGSSFHLWSSNWGTLVSAKAKPYQDLLSPGIRIRRGDMREIYVQEAEKEIGIQWNIKCTAAERLPDGRLQVSLSRATPDRDAETFTAQCDLLIAADGAHSAIRASFRPSDKLEYAGAVQMGGVSRLATGIPKEIGHNWGVVVTGAGVGCFLSPNDDTGVVWALSFMEPERQTAFDASSKDDLDSLKQEALSRGCALHEPFQSLVHATELGSGLMIPARDKKPFGHAGDDSLMDVVFMGDSNHAVSPFAGNGANLALKDGIDLAEQLCASTSLAEAVAAYDKLMVPRAEETLLQSHRAIGGAHATGPRYYALRAVLWLINCFMYLTGRG